MADLSTLIGDDYLLFDGEQTLTLSQSGIGSLPVAGCTSSPLTRKQIEMLGGTVGLQSTYRNFSLPVANLGAKAPRDGDTLAEAAPSQIVWKIQSAELRTLSTRWFCMCYKTQ